MINHSQLYKKIYEDRVFDHAARPLAADPLTAVPSGVRPNSIAIEGGAFGDEGKGRIVDEVCQMLIGKTGKGIVYRWNGGANAGHTVVIGDKRLALHQFPSGAISPGATVVLGRGMVLHPGDLVAEMARIVRVIGEFPGTLMIDRGAVLALDTHRALEGALKGWASGGLGATGRGISPAYADVLYRHPVRVRDLAAAGWQETLGKHYDLYAAQVSGLGADLAAIEVARLDADPIPVGSKSDFLGRLAEQRDQLIAYMTDTYPFLASSWADPTLPFIFEGAQAVGLDPRFGVYPDVTASDPTFSGIIASTEGLVKSNEIAVRAAVIKATYMSSVGQRNLPTMMDEALAHRIREDAFEYGATTKRPRDIAHIDASCMNFYARVSDATHLVLTHLDIAYPEIPIQVATHYHDPNSVAVGYRPDQTYLDSVTPQYASLPAWDGKSVENVTDLSALPEKAHQYIAYLCDAMGLAPLFGTTGPQRDAIISWLPR